MTIISSRSAHRRRHIHSSIRSRRHRHHYHSQQLHQKQQKQQHQKHHHNFSGTLFRVVKNPQVTTGADMRIKASRMHRRAQTFGSGGHNIN